MKRLKIICLAATLAAPAILGSMLLAAETETAPGPSRVFVSFLWAGKADADCMLRDTLLTDTAEDCEKEYTRAEGEIKDLVARRNEKGAGWKWGVFAKCASLPDQEAYAKELDKLRKRCMGK